MQKWLPKKRFVLLVVYTMMVLAVGGFIGGFIHKAESYDSCTCPGAGNFYTGIERHDDVTKPDYGIFYWIRNTDSTYKIKAVFGGVGSNTITIHFVKSS
jgi:hypothetical protein